MNKQPEMGNTELSDTCLNEILKASINQLKREKGEVGAKDFVAHEIDKLTRKYPNASRDIVEKMIYEGWSPEEASAEDELRNLGFKSFAVRREDLEKVFEIFRNAEHRLTLEQVVTKIVDLGYSHP
jgi:hypothetical protein